MGLFTKTSLGLEIGKDGLKFALASHDKGSTRLDAYAVAPLPAEIVKFSLREPNILQPGPFVTQVRAAWSRLLTKSTRTCVTLPDSCGRVLLLDLETRFRSHEEGAGIIRWKLKKQSSLDVHETHLDYQVIRERETGELIALVSLIARPVIAQYEELLQEAGLDPHMIEFTTFSLHRLFAPRLDSSDAGVLISWFGGCLGVMVFYDGILEFFRSKEMAGGRMDATRIYQEVNSSLLVYREKNPTRDLGTCFCFAESSQWESLRDIIIEATGQEPLHLEAGRFIQAGSGITLDSTAAHLLSASLGTAVRVF